MCVTDSEKSWFAKLVTTTVGFMTSSFGWQLEESESKAKQNTNRRHRYYFKFYLDRKVLELAVVFI